MHGDLPSDSLRARGGGRSPLSVLVVDHKTDRHLGGLLSHSLGRDHLRLFEVRSPNIEDRSPNSLSVYGSGSKQSLWETIRYLYVDMCLYVSLTEGRYSNKMY